MLQLFRTNQFFANILLLFYIIVLRLFVWIVPAVERTTGKGVFSLGAEYWLPTSGFGSEVVAILLLLIQAVLLNFLVSEYRIGKEITLFPGLFYVLLVCSLPDFVYWSPVLLANTFFLISLVALFSGYKKSSAAGAIFNTGFSLALASLFYYPYLWYFLMALIGINILRSFRVKEVLMLLIGFLVPYFLTAVYYFWIDDLGGFWDRQFSQNHTLLDFNFQMDWIDMTKLGLFALLILIAILSYGRYLMKKNIQVQKYISILYWGLLFAGLTWLLQDDIAFDQLLLLAPSLAIFMSLSFLDLNRSYAELGHLLLLFLVFFFQYGRYLGLG